MMKKSLEEAMNRAVEHSKEHPDVIVRVMDKKKKRSVVCASEWICKERILGGWCIVAEYKNGVRIR